MYFRLLSKYAGGMSVNEIIGKNIWEGDTSLQYISEESMNYNVDSVLYCNYFRREAEFTTRYRFGFTSISELNVSQK